MILTTIWVAEVTAAFETAMLFSAVGQLMKALGDPIKVGWLMTAYLLVGAGAGAVVARLGDIYGRRRLTLILLGITVFASALSASTSLFPLILIGRALQGLSAAMLPLCFGLARENVPPERRSVAVGVIMSGSSAGIALGLVAGGVIVDHFDWHAVFIVSAIMAAVSFLMVRVFIPPSPKAPSAGERLDFGSVFLFVPAISALLLAISNGKSWGWTSMPVLALTAAGLALLFAWIRRSLRHPSPLIDVRLFTNRSVAIANISYALLALGGLQVSMIFSLLLQAPTWTGVGLGVSAAMAGLLQLPGSVIGVVAGPAAGLAMQRVGSRAVMLTGGAIATLGWIVTAFYHGTPLAVMLLVLLINTGTFLIFAAGPNVVMDNVPPERTSEATGMLAVIRSLAMGVGTQVAAVMLASSTVSDNGATHYPDASAFLLTLAVIVVLCALATLAAWMLPTRKPAFAD
jgi:MFS family permease